VFRRDCGLHVGPKAPLNRVDHFSICSNHLGEQRTTHCGVRLTWYRAHKGVVRVWQIPRAEVALPTTRPKRRSTRQPRRRDKRKKSTTSESVLRPRRKRARARFSSRPPTRLWLSLSELASRIAMRFEADVMRPERRQAEKMCNDRLDAGFLCKHGCTHMAIDNQCRKARIGAMTCRNICHKATSLHGSKKKLNKTLYGDNLISAQFPSAKLQCTYCLVRCLVSRGFGNQTDANGIRVRSKGRAPPILGVRRLRFFGL